MLQKQNANQRCDMNVLSGLKMILCSRPTCLWERTPHPLEGFFYTSLSMTDQQPLEQNL